MRSKDQPQNEGAKTKPREECRCEYHIAGSIYLVPIENEQERKKNIFGWKIVVKK
jgi:hypothetical protein